jgi:hypothetical protein
MLIYLKFEKLPVPFWIRTQFLARDYISVYPAFTDEDCIFISKELEILLSEKGDGSEGASALRLHKILQSWKSSDAGVVSKLRMRKKFVVRAWLKRVVLKLLKNCIPSLIERIQIGSRYLAFFELVNGRVFPPELSKNLIHKVHEKDLFFALGLWTYFSE